MTHAYHLDADPVVFSADNAVNPPKSAVRPTPLLALLLLLLVAVCATAMLVWVARQTAADVRRTLAVREKAGEVVRLMLGAEAGQRGFLATRDQAYLEPLTLATGALPAAVRELRSLATDSNAQRSLLDQIEALTAKRLADLQHAVELARTGKPDAALQSMQATTAKAAMDQLHDRLAEVQATELDLLEGRRQSADGMSLLLFMAVLCAVTGVAILGMLHLVAGRRRVDGQADLNRRLESLISQRTHALRTIPESFSSALHAAGVTVLHQDAKLHYTWASHQLVGHPPGAIVGRQDTDILPASAAAILIEAKQAALLTGQGATVQAAIPGGDGEHWLDVRIEPQKDDAGTVTGLVTVATDITGHKRHEGTIRLLMREMMHRSRNTLAVIQAMARQTASHSTSLSDFTQRFSQRLRALAASYDILVDEAWESAPLTELVRSQLDHYADLIGTRIFLLGPVVRLTPEAAQSVGMAFHELGTNAAKYGALSTQEGRIDISWKIERPPADAPYLAITWQESGGPVVVEPTQRGFGHTVIERMASAALGGEVVLEFAPTGVRWFLQIPLNHVLNAA